MEFSPVARISQSALKNNLEVVRRHAPNSKVMAVIKANAYGHGVENVVEALLDADGYAVARVEEAMELRSYGIDKPIIVMGGAYNHVCYQFAAEHHLTLTIHHGWQLDLLRFQKLPSPVEFIVKVDTGMHRLGVRPDQVESVLAELNQLGYGRTPPVLMTHLANGDDRNDPMTERQWQEFKPLVEKFGAEFSMANSSGILGWPELHGDCVRPGIMLYGVSPFVGTIGEEFGLQPVMTFQSRLVSVKRLNKGDSIGYSGTWTCPEDMLVGVIAVGYGDGYPRHASADTPVLVNGERVSLVGRVSMDMITVDLRSQPNAKVGDPVVLWGEGLPAEEVAQSSATIAYQLFCSVTKRVRFESVV